MSIAKLILSGIRISGTPVYYPAHRRADGSITNARTEASAHINNSYVNADGQRVESSDVIRLVFWNGSNAKPGKGLADVAAKYLCTGKEIAYCEATVNVYQGRVYGQDDTPLAFADGTMVMTKRISFVVQPGTLRLGDDSEKHLAAEYAAFNGQMNFSSRPADWRTAGSVGYQQWQSIAAWRASQVFDPKFNAYGYANVGKVTGELVAGAPVAQPVAQQAGAVSGGQVSSNTVVGNVVSGSTVDGAVPAGMPSAEMAVADESAAGLNTY